MAFQIFRQVEVIDMKMFQNNCLVVSRVDNHIWIAIYLCDKVYITPKAVIEYDYLTCIVVLNTI